MVLVGCVVFYTKFDPTQHAWMPQCPFRLLTGWSCPACGMQRALHAVLHGHFLESLSYNYFLILGIPYALALIVAEVLQSLHRGERFVHMAQHPVIARVYLVLFLVWGVVRNVFDL